MAYRNIGLSWPIMNLVWLERANSELFETCIFIAGKLWDFVGNGLKVSKKVANFSATRGQTAKKITCLCLENYFLKSCKI